MKWRTLFAIMASVAMIIIVATTVAYAQGTSFYAIANVDGDDNEWDPTSDYCLDMIQAGGQGGQESVLSTVCLRYECTSETLYALVKTEGSIIADGQEEHWIKQAEQKLVDDQSGDDNAAPDFAWIGLSGETAVGWEASCLLEDDLQTDLVVHTLVWYDNESQTSATKPFSLEINCIPTAIEIPNFSAMALPNNPALADKLLLWGSAIGTIVCLALLIVCVAICR